MILVINPGSSSLKYKLFDASLKAVFQDDITLGENIPANEAVLNKILEDLGENLSNIEKVAVRVVHGGPRFSEAVQVTEEVISEISKFSTLAPLHNSQALSIIVALVKKFGLEKVYAVFDTGFFNSLPVEVSTYPVGPVDTILPIRRYGFHGISHNYMKEIIDPANKKRIVTLHLGAGCSISAVNKGQVIATSMGLTPDEGLMMQTRSGDLDPGLVLYLVKEKGYNFTKKLIEQESGLAGMTGTDGNMLDILELAGEKVFGVEHICKYEKTGENRTKSQLALNIYVNKIRQYIGGYAALMGGLDEVAFSGKIGAGSPVIRDKVMSELSFLGNLEVRVVEPDEELAMAKGIIKLQVNQ